MFNNLISVFQKMIVNKSLAFGAVTGTIGVFLDEKV